MMNYVILDKTNVVEISEKTDYDESTLVKYLIQYYAAGVYPVKIPMAGESNAAFFGTRTY